MIQTLQCRIRDLEAEIEELTRARAIAEMQRDRMERSWRTVSGELDEERKTFQAQMKSWEDVTVTLREQLVRANIEGGRREIDKNAATSLLKEAEDEKENTRFEMKLKSDALMRQQALEHRYALEPSC